MKKTECETEQPLVVVDVGAAGGVDIGWQALPESTRVFAFEPDEDECHRLTEASTRIGSPRVKYIPLALGATEGAAPFFKTMSAHCCSNLPPIEDLCGRFPTLAQMAIESVTEIQLTTLDEWCRENAIDVIDFIKLDTQGTELDILRGAHTILESVLIVETEVEFNPLYEHQALFGELDAHLRAQGFELWGFDSLNHCQLRGINDGSTELDLRGDGRSQRVQRPAGQLMWGQAFYVRATLLGTSTTESLMSQRHRAWSLARARGLRDLARTLAHLLEWVEVEVEGSAITETEVELRAQLHLAQEELTRLRSSRSYRLTHPLRIIRSRFGSSPSR